MSRNTHTYVTCEVSATAYDEIATILRKAGYDHVFGFCGEIDMHGIALTSAPTASKWRHVKTGKLYEIIVPRATAEWDGATPFVVYRGEDGAVWLRPFNEFHDGRFVEEK